MHFFFIRHAKIMAVSLTFRVARNVSGSPICLGWNFEMFQVNVFVMWQPCVPVGKNRANVAGERFEMQPQKVGVLKVIHFQFNSCWYTSVFYFWGSLCLFGCLFFAVL